MSEDYLNFDTFQLWFEELRRTRRNSSTRWSLRQARQKRQRDSSYGFSCCLNQNPKGGEYFIYRFRVFCCGSSRRHEAYRSGKKDSGIQSCARIERRCQQIKHRFSQFPRPFPVVDQSWRRSSSLECLVNPPLRSFALTSIAISRYSVESLSLLRALKVKSSRRPLNGAAAPSICIENIRSRSLLLSFIPQLVLFVQRHFCHIQPAPAAQLFHVCKARVELVISRPQR